MIEVLSRTEPALANRILVTCRSTSPPELARCSSSGQGWTSPLVTNSLPAPPVPRDEADGQARERRRRQRNPLGAELVERLNYDGLQTVSVLSYCISPFARW